MLRAPRARSITLTGCKGLSLHSLQRCVEAAGSSLEQLRVAATVDFLSLPHRAAARAIWAAYLPALTPAPVTQWPRC